MPLSDHEQKLLAQMEQALYAEDPKFATTLTGRQRGVGSLSRALVGIGSVALGLTLVIVGITIGQLWLSVIGFVVMFGGVVFAVAAPAPSGSARTGRTAPGKPQRGGSGSRGRSSFVQRMEERWERRENGGM